MEENKEPAKEETIFSPADFSTQKYDKHIGNARTTLYAVSGLVLLAGLVATVRSPNEMMLDIWIEVVIIGGTFLVLGIWSNSKSFSALLIGLIVYGLYHILYMIIDPTNIYRGLIIKVIIVIYLIRGMNNAREAQEWKKTFNNERRE